MQAGVARDAKDFILPSLSIRSEPPGDIVDGSTTRTKLVMTLK
jgi:hypothetical protein